MPSPPEGPARSEVPMKVDVQDRSGVQVVRVLGETIGGEDQILVETVTGLLGSRGARIVIDLSEVKFINSTGLGALVSLAAQANVKESHVVLANPSAFVTGVLETTQLDRFFRIHPSIDAAIASLT
jgi:anti-sigma B factor antagonist